jgi:hypothetical protein
MSRPREVDGWASAADNTNACLHMACNDRGHRWLRGARALTRRVSRRSRGYERPLPWDRWSVVWPVAHPPNRRERQQTGQLRVVQAD